MTFDEFEVLFQCIRDNFKGQQYGVMHKCVTWGLAKDMKAVDFKRVVHGLVSFNELPPTMRMIKSAISSHKFLHRKYRVHPTHLQRI
jgi:hypothetical protein